MKSGGFLKSITTILAFLIVIGLIVWGIVVLKSNGYTFQDVLSWLTEYALWIFMGLLALGIAIPLLMIVFSWVFIRLPLPLAFLGFITLVNGHTIAGIIMLIAAAVIEFITCFWDDGSL